MGTAANPAEPPVTRGSGRTGGTVAAAGIAAVTAIAAVAAVAAVAAISTGCAVSGTSVEAALPRPEEREVRIAVLSIIMAGSDLTTGGFIDEGTWGNRGLNNGCSAWRVGGSGKASNIGYEAAAADAWPGVSGGRIEADLLPFMARFLIT